MPSACFVVPRCLVGTFLKTCSATMWIDSTVHFKPRQKLDSPFEIASTQFATECDIVSERMEIRTGDLFIK